MRIGRGRLGLGSRLELGVCLLMAAAACDGGGRDGGAGGAGASNGEGGAGSAGGSNAEGGAGGSGGEEASGGVDGAGGAGGSGGEDSSGGEDGTGGAGGSGGGDGMGGAGGSGGSSGSAGTGGAGGSGAGAGGSGGSVAEGMPDGGGQDLCASVPNACAPAATRCDGDDLVTCAANNDGCLVETTTDCTAGGADYCDSSASPRVCATCPANDCTDVGSSCDGNALTTCTLERSGCLVQTTTDCAADSPGYCDDAVTPKACRMCPATDCTAEGTSCDGLTLVTCTPDANGCLVETRTGCATLPLSGGEEGACVSDGGTAACGTRCYDETGTQITCPPEDCVSSGAELVPWRLWPTPWTPENTSSSLAPACIGEPYSQWIRIDIGDTWPFQDLSLDVTGMSFNTSNAITGLPFGLTYSCQPPNCFFGGQRPACLQIYGTPSGSPGTFDLIITAQIYHTVGGFPLEVAVPADFRPDAHYYLPVGPAGSCP